MELDTSPRTFNIAGVRFRDDNVAVLDLVLAHRRATHFALTPVKLVGEPGNKFDRYAVKILFSYGQVDYLLGYVPKPINVDIWALRDAGYTPEAKLDRVFLDAPTHERYHVSVSFTKKS